MNLRTFHMKIQAAQRDKPLTINDITESLESRGYTPQLKNTFSGLNSKLASADLPSFPLVMDPDAFEIMLLENKSCSVLLRFNAVGDDRPPVLLPPTAQSGEDEVDLELLVVSTHRCELDAAVADIRVAIDGVTGGELSENSLTELARIRALKARFGDLSPNGKLIAQPEIAKACASLSNDETRQSVSPIANAFGVSPTPRSGLEQLDVFVGSVHLLDNVLNDSEIMVSHFSVSCENCATAQIAFPSRSKADDVVSDANRYCGACGKRSLCVVETFALREQYNQALRQGLWLESLVAETLKSRTDAVWCGQMAKNDEVDVIAVYAEQLILFECKDQNLGANDAYVTAAKAQNVDADLTVIVTTNDVHQNVLEVIREMASNSRESQLEVVSEPTSEGIQAALAETLDKAARRSSRRWMVESLGFPYYNFRRYPF